MQSVKKYWVIADIHGEMEKFNALLENMRTNGFDLEDKNQVLVQLGDRNDRGPDSYAVNEWFRTKQLQYSGQVIVLLGNHDRMMIDAAEGRSDLMYYNGGYATASSYMHCVNSTTHHGNSYKARFFPSAMRASGHLDWLKSLPKFHETEEYFFSHAPIPKEEFRTLPVGVDFRQDEHTLTWSFVDERTERWVDPNLVPVAEEGVFYEGKGKTCVYGHIHGIRRSRNGEDVQVPGPRVHGNAVLLDTGCGCHPHGYVSALLLPQRRVFTSRGNMFDLDEHARLNKEQEEREARELLRQRLGISDEKVDF